MASERSLFLDQETKSDNFVYSDTTFTSSESTSDIENEKLFIEADDLEEFGGIRNRYIIINNNSSFLKKKKKKSPLNNNDYYDDSNEFSFRLADKDNITNVGNNTKNDLKSIAQHNCSSMLQLYQKYETKQTIIVNRNMFIDFGLQNKTRKSIEGDFINVKTFLEFLNEIDIMFPNNKNVNHLFLLEFNRFIITWDLKLLVKIIRRLKAGGKEEEYDEPIASPNSLVPM